MVKVFTLILGLWLLASCSTTHVAGVVYHDRFDFAAVKTYSLYERNSTFSETQNLLDSRRNAIEIAIEKVMAQKKFSYASTDIADVIVTYHLMSRRRDTIQKYNDVVHFCQHCLRASAWNTENQYDRISPGSLILDIVDPKQQRSVWRSSYPLDIDETDNSAVNNEKIQQAVWSMLNQYPRLIKQ